MVMVQTEVSRLQVRGEMIMMSDQFENSVI